MELSIPAYSIKEFTAILKSFKSFSNFLHIHSHPSRLKISAVSPTRSTFAVAIFEKTFFDSYRLLNPTIGLIEIAAKPLHKIFAQSNLISALESCKISIDSEDETNQVLKYKNSTLGTTTATQHPTIQHRITIKIKSNVGITRSFVLPYSNSRTLNPTDLRCDNSPNRWICLSSNLKQWVDHFVVNPNITQNLVGSPDTIEDICFCYLVDQQVTLKTLNLADASNINAILPKKHDIFTKGVRQLSTTLTVNSSEFESFQVDTSNGPIITTMSIKEVRSIFELGTVLGSAIDAGFSVGGRPVYFSITNEEGCVGVEFVLASTDGEELGVLDPNSTNHQKQTGLGNNNTIAEGNSRGQEKNRGIRESPSSSRTDSPAQSNQNNHHIHGPSKLRDNAINSFHNLDNRNKQQVGFKPVEETNETTHDEDELDHIPPDQWAQVEQDAIHLSQSRQRAKIAQSQSLTNDDNDEQLLPSQAHHSQNHQPHWKLFFD